MRTPQGGTIFLSVLNNAILRSYLGSNRIGIFAVKGAEIERRESQIHRAHAPAAHGKAA
jgi:hypothetical protein